MWITQDLPLSVYLKVKAIYKNISSSLIIDIYGHYITLYRQHETTVVKRTEEIPPELYSHLLLDYTYPVKYQALPFTNSS